MLKSLFVASAALAATAFVFAQEPSTDKGAEHAAEKKVPQHGVAMLIPTTGNRVGGTIMFSEEGEGVRVKGRVFGLTPGKHGFHVHEFGDLRSADGTSAGDHYNPEGVKHGAPGDQEHHVGDLGNIEANEEGVAEVDIEAPWMKLHFVMGRAVVVHAEADDLKSQPSGDAGGRVAVGVIGVANPKMSNADDTAVSRPKPVQ